MKDPTVEISDEEVALLVQQGDKEKFALLIDRYEKRLSRYGAKFLSNKENIVDIVQEVFISTYQNLKSFDTSQKFSSWIYRIAHNAFVNSMKKNLRNQLLFFDLDTLISHPIYVDPAQAEIESKEMRDIIEKGLETLPSKYKEIIILHYLEELSYKEIADILRIPLGTVGIRLKRAKGQLKKSYEKLNLTYGA